MPVTFDGVNLTILLDGSTEVDVQVDLYSDWKEWFKTPGNSKYNFAFDTGAGDPTRPGEAVSPFFFLRNDLGWRIMPPEMDIEIRFIGNLFRRDFTKPMFTSTIGAFTVSLELEISPQSLTVTQGGGGDIQTAIDILEADEEFTNTQVTKRHKTSKSILVQKNRAGGNLAGTITLDE